MGEAEVQTGLGRVVRGVPDDGPGEVGPVDVQPVGLADLVDDLIDRFDRVRHRPVVLVGLGGLILAVAVAAWWFDRAADAPPLDELIPMVDTERADSPTPVDAGSSVASAETASQPGLGPGSGSGSGADEADDATTASSDDGAVRPGATTLVVHVLGEVVRPGLVELPVGSRVADAIEAVGGATERGDPHRLNLAAPVVDGLRVRVPGLGEAADGVAVDDPLLSLPAADIGTAGSVGEGAGVVEAGPVDLNTADATRLETLPGVGPVTAAAIEAWRRDHGPFHAVDDLLSVPGIGPAKLEGLRDLVTV